VWRLLLEAHHNLAGRLERDLEEEHGFGLDWYDVLYQLSRAGGRLRMHELADATLFSRTDCTRLVDRLEVEGLVGREPDTADRRGVFAVLTGEGKATLRRAAVTHLDGIQRYFGAHLTPDQVGVMHTALRQVVDA